MRGRKYIASILVCTSFCLFKTNITAQERVRLGLGFLTGSAGGVFAAVEGNTFKNHNLDVTSIFIQSSAAILPALLSGEVDIITIAPQVIFRAYRQGSKNLVFTGTLIKKFTFALYVKPEITAASQLKGKAIGVTRYGGSLDLGLRFALNSVGLSPERDNIIVPQVGRLSDLVLALKTGRIDGAMLTSVYALEAEEARFRKLLDLADSDIEFTQSGFATTREVISRRKPVVKAFMAAFKEGLDLFINDENLGKRALGKHTGVKSEKLLEADYKNFSQKYLPRDPTTTQKSMDLVFETMGIKDVEEKKRIFDAVVDNSFL